MKIIFTSLLAISVSMSLDLSNSQSEKMKSPIVVDKKGTAGSVYDGNWWLAADSNERGGFLDGALDCLVWTAHTKPPREIDNLEEKITQYYKSHPADRNGAILSVWERVSSLGPPSAPPPSGGEVYRNPHGYYNGEFWREGSESANRGFLEGYFWCLQTHVKSPTDTYSQSIDYYWDKIWTYIQSHPKTSVNEPVAVILSKFRDRPKSR
jgi:hypothetical protein